MIDYKKLAIWLRNSKESTVQKWHWFIRINQMGWRVTDQRDALFFCDWQWRDTDDFLTTYHKMFLDWCRNSGKTEKAALLAIFMAILGNEPQWFCKSTKQFMRVQDLFNRSPFCIKHKPSRLRKEIYLVTGDRITMDVLIKNENASGPHPRCGFYDEFAEMEMDFIQKSFGMYGDDPYLLFISTPVKDSPTTTIREMYETRTHTYLECAWKNAADIESLRLAGYEDLWAQEFLCKEISRQGCIFTNIIPVTVFPTQFSFVWQGIDYGSASHNTLVRLGWVDGMWWVLLEKVFRYRTDDAELQQYANLYPTEDECGGWNDIHAADLINVTHEDFSKHRGQFKKDRMQALLSAPICIDKHVTPYTFRQMGNTFFEPDGRVDTKVLHNVAAMLHAVKSTLPMYQENQNATANVMDMPHFLKVRQ